MRVRGQKMDKLKRMQKLHQLAVKGEALTAEDQTALQNWYQTLDREEDLILNNSQLTENSQDLREYLADTTRQVAKISREVETLVVQNATLRNENRALRKSLEERLLEKVA